MTLVRGVMRRGGGGGGGATVAASETAALVQAMTIHPGAERLGRIDALITALKVAGVWSRLDCLYVMAAHDAQAAQLNWKSPGVFRLTPVNSPVFTADRGYAGDGATAYLDSGYNAMLEGAQSARDDNHAGIWVQSSSGASASTEFGNPRNRISAHTVSGLSTRSSANSSGAATPVATALGHSAFVRTTGPTYDDYRNGALLSPQSVASASPTTDRFLLLARDGGGTPAELSARRLAAAHWGASLTGLQMTALYAALQGYLAAVGAA